MATDLIHTKAALKKSKVPLGIMFLAMCFALYPAIWVNLSESRFYRDLMNLTPFKRVEIHKVVIEGDTMTIWGALQKVRCTKVGGHAYTQGADGYNYLAQFSPADEHPLTPENRPTTGRAELFGPWFIISVIPNPERASFYPVHRCNGILENNVFFDTPWENFEMENKE